MSQFDARNRLTKLTILSGAGGVLLSIFIYLVLFRITGLSFTFENLKSLHLSHPFLFLFDILGVFLALGAYYLVSGLIRENIDLLAAQEADSKVKNGVREFVDHLIHGKLEQASGPDLLEGELAISLQELREALIHNQQEVRKRKLEDDQRNWISEGLAQIGDLLRTYTDDLESLGYTIISFLVRYLNANQGGFFIVEGLDEERQLRMIACHAYDRKKFPDSVVAWGEGLIGAVALEKKSYYTSKIPDAYLTISSGLGKANPKHLLITPLILNNKVFGVFEIASFKAIETHQRVFIERASESAAVTLNAIESSIRTSQLLRETQAQTTMLEQQEEQVRKNIEELKQTQLEAALQAEQFISFTNSVNHTLIRAEYDVNGVLLYANTKFLKKLGYSGNREVEGKPISIFIHDKDLEWFNGMWKKLAGGGQHFEGYMKHITKQGQDLWTMATYTCVRKDDGGVEKILFLALDTTEYKKQSIDYEGQLEAINRLSQKAEFTPDGKILASNELFRSALKYTPAELKQLNVFDFITRSDQERFNEVWDNVIKGVPYQGQMKLRNKYDEEIWFRSTFTSINDMYNEVEKVIFIANEISKEKEMESEMIRQNAQLAQKEEEFRLLSLDLKKRLDESTGKWHLEKEELKKNADSYYSVLRNSPQALILFTNTGYLSFINKAGEKLFGVKNTIVSGNKLESLFIPDESDEFIRALCDPTKQKKEGVYKSVGYSSQGSDRHKATLHLFKTEKGDEEIFAVFFVE